MRVQNIQPNINFKNTEQPKKQNKQEIIDYIVQSVINPRDVNDCVAVPRGIFKAYMFIMSGFALLSIGNALPQKLSKIKTTLAVLGNVLNVFSAYFFAKPFFIKSLSPTVKLEDYNKLS